MSDVDLLVIMPVAGRTMDKAMEILGETRPTFAVDLLVRTPEEMESRVAMGDFFLREILRQGKVLYDAAHCGVPFWRTK